MVFPAAHNSLKLWFYCMMLDNIIYSSLQNRLLFVCIVIFNCVLIMNYDHIS